MATINQIKELFKSHFNEDNEKFKVIALQIAAHEAKIGHTSSARELKAIIDNSPSTKNKVVKLNDANKLFKLEYPSAGIEQLVVSEDIEVKIDRIISEYKKRNILLKYGLKNRSKLLLEGEPGTGKTMTASVIGHELQLPLYTVQIHSLISKYMGETSVKLKEIFEQIQENRGVYFFDEFDAIGSDRRYDNDVGEMRRILNSFLQYIETDDSSSIIICATNNPSMLDKALFRRFDDVFEYRFPDEIQIIKLLKLNLQDISFNQISINKEIVDSAKGLSHSEIVTACNETKKYSLLSEDNVDNKILLQFLKERRKFMKYQEDRS
ncbi:ATP-binding protein [Aerococcus sp. UMB1112A]|uniref:AAA family ATPase n=1 Tax=unclassified Aerococcus TaxID=2618060 RepID=UPI0008A13E97|nr:MULTISPECIES: ATP-binding protein [unclassified Aerococcus]KAB0645237.1 AAA family ATPase [Aerococcus sanguinicola]MDK8503298.1 ATP-binding protein [Aerococcus sp. UMB1112A]OFN05344.1 ATPase [Aerococcus sp. HMSC062A02]OHO42773.1 ATPase [Aerococcus sp. HMSC035B07]